MAPVTGTIQQLAIHTVGGVVAPGDPLMIVVPEGSDLLVEAKALNRDIGFIEVGQDVRVKVDSFHYTKYGLLQGVITHISADAVEDERRGLIFPIHVAIVETSILVENRQVPLAPGMSVTADIKTGDRRIIEYFLSPLLRYRDATLKER